MTIPDEIKLHQQLNPTFTEATRPRLDPKYGYTVENYQRRKPLYLVLWIQVALFTLLGMAAIKGGIWLVRFVFEWRAGR